MPIININKPVGITSHDVVSRIRKITGVRRVGHAGTLDPLAAGVLVVGIGREATTKLEGVMKTGKTYRAIITLGANSETDDAEGELQPVDKPPKPELLAINTCLKQFVGEIQQEPPRYSAIKINGKAAYKYARKGQRVALGLRTVTIDSIKVLYYRWPQLEIEVECGSGVYIRSLARDIGKVLGTGGYLSGLVRTRVGEYALDQAMSPEQFGEWWMLSSKLKEF